MRLFNFFRKKDKVKELSENEKITFKELERYLANEQEKLEIKESEFFETINNLAIQHSLEVEKKIRILEEIDINSKKIEERAKIIVNQSVEKYVIEVKKLLAELKDSKKDTIQEFINHINKIFLNFNKRSAIFYGRSNYIIGDELLAVKNSIQKIYQEFETLIISEKELIAKSTTIKDIKSLQKNIEEKTKKKEQAIEEINRIASLIEEKEQIIEKIESSNKKFQKSEEYSSFRKSIEDIKEKEQTINKLIIECKNLINFKELMGLYYSSELKKEIVKKYRDSFSVQFSKTNAKELLDLIDDSKINNREKILLAAKNIADEKEKVIENKKHLDSDPLERENEKKEHHAQDIKRLE